MGEHGPGRPSCSPSEGGHGAGADAPKGGARLHPKIAKGCTPDFVLPGRRVAVFVDGCFWHGCPEHGRTTPWTGPNAQLWADKMVRNAERDRASSQLAQDAGWQVVRVWECQIRRDPGAIALRVLALRAPVP